MADLDDTAARKRRIALVVEDDAPIRALISIMLRRIGFETLEAADGEEALQRLKAGNSEIHLLVVDLMMPELNGWDLVTWTKTNRPELCERTLIVTAAGAKQLARLPEGSYAAILEKPFDHSNFYSQAAACAGIAADWNGSAAAERPSIESGTR